VLIAVAGSSGLNEVRGVGSADPAALLRAVPPGSTSHVLLLTPQHTVTVAREQAHVLIAGDPQVRVCVLPLPHHAFTLTLVAAAVLNDPTWPVHADPGAAVQLIIQSAQRSRSLVWYSRLWGLQEPRPTLRQRVASRVSTTGFFTEVGVSAGLVRSGAESLPGLHELVCLPLDPPSPLRDQLGGARRVSVPVTVEPSRPYASKGCVELTVLVGPAHGPFATASCTSCSATVVGGECVFCGHGPGNGAGLGHPAAAGRSTTSAQQLPPTVEPAQPVPVLQPDHEGVPA
jgi:hypothetical protein